ncbi:MAG: glycosyltransferase, partial [Vicinamibacteria bacterium]
ERRVSPFADLRSLRELVSLLKAGNYGIVHTHNPKVNVLGPIAARLARVPATVATVHGYYVDDRSLWARKAFYLGIDRSVAPLIDRIFFLSDEDLALARWLRMKKSEALIALGAGVDLQRFRCERLSFAERRRIDAELGLRPGWPVVALLGRLVDEKGIQDFLHAAQILRDRLERVQFLVIGPSEIGSKTDAVDPSSLGAGLGDWIRFTGLRTDLDVVLRRLDLLLLPSRREGLPRSLIEAAACGVPVAASDIRGCREVVEDGVTGFLVPVGDPLALANAAARILTNRALAASMREAARRRAERLFAADRVHERIALEYQALVEERGIARARRATA